MMPGMVRQTLPKLGDRISLGRTGLQASPICLGMTASPETIVAAYEAGINFFFVTGDLHWPLYDGIRRGLSKLLDGNTCRRDEIIVGVVSYLDNPLFAALQFHEVIDVVPGLKRVDLLIAGAVSSNENFFPRVQAMAAARAAGQHGARAIGATFHQRSLALVAEQYDLLDIRFIRYNSAHPGARRDLFPYIRPGRTSPIFNFKSTMSQVPGDIFDALNLPASYWRPDVCDYYRFVLTRPEIDGILCSPMQPEQVRQLERAIDKGPLSRDEEEYMIWLSSLVHAPVLT